MPADTELANIIRRILRKEGMFAPLQLQKLHVRTTHAESEAAVVAFAADLAAFSRSSI
jgi:hypothetical protein